MKKIDGEEYKVKSLVKAMNVLECFSAQKNKLGVTEISQMLGIQKTSVYNILSTFEQMGYVTQDAETGKYTLGFKLLGFSYTISSNLDISRVFASCMMEAANQIGEMCLLGVPFGTNVLYLDIKYPNRTTGRSLTGEQAPMYCTGIGKAMLAFSSENLINTVIEQPMIRFTEYTMCSPQQLLDNLEEVRKNGYSFDNMEHEYGIRCVGVPIFGRDKQVIAAISMMGPSLRFGLAHVPEIARKLITILEPFQYQL